MDIGPEESTNATWRYDCPGNTEAGYSFVHSLQSPSGENEPTTSETESTSPTVSPEIWFWIIRLAAIGYVTGLLIQLWQEDEVRLHLLHGSIKLLQASARLFGGWALHIEHLYNQY